MRTNNELTVLYEDAHLIAVDKPAGLLMHPSWLDRHEKDTLASRVKVYLESQGGESTTVHTIHRLDRPTSGVVLIAKEKEIARQLADQFLQKSVKKCYHAIVRGFSPPASTVDYPLVEEQDAIADKFARENKPAQPATTLVKRLAISELSLPVSGYPKARFSLVECVPLTGRKHQIRRHLKHLGYPIVGDTRHGCRHNNKLLRAHQLNELALRSVSIEFTHPNSGQRIEIFGGDNESWSRFHDFFGWVVTEKNITVSHSFSEV